MICVPYGRMLQMEYQDVTTLPHSSASFHTTSLQMEYQDVTTLPHSSASFHTTSLQMEYQDGVSGCDNPAPLLSQLPHHILTDGVSGWSIRMWQPCPTPQPASTPHPYRWSIRMEYQDVVTLPHSSASFHTTSLGYCDIYYVANIYIYWLRTWDCHKNHPLVGSKRGMLCVEYFPSLRSSLWECS